VDFTDKKTSESRSIPKGLATLDCAGKQFRFQASDEVPQILVKKSRRQFSLPPAGM
jgi:hypothetical protein